jgi:hypothetical protein
VSKINADQSNAVVFAENNVLLLDVPIVNLEKAQILRRGAAQRESLENLFLGREFVSRKHSPVAVQGVVLGALGDNYETLRQDKKFFEADDAWLLQCN